MVKHLEFEWIWYLNGTPWQTSLLVAWSASRGSKIPPSAMAPFFRTLDPEVHALGLLQRWFTSHGPKICRTFFFPTNPRISQKWYPHHLPVFCCLNHHVWWLNHVKNLPFRHGFSGSPMAQVAQSSFRGLVSVEDVFDAAQAQLSGWF